ncbi:TPA: hypothetical protein ACGOWW_000128 [Streptococcus suis]|uniref:Uncharacterized protein n=1 Tax=Streptococcus suis TaxID=1307 RepID=A0A123TAD1_STRSU|nr:hypothetical protein [Streptococcus suis]MDG4500817.1 hypothetical protein [Streptococcus suis]MDG4525934.1 hypothetical protein [Streptococcus suis]MDG4528320.1 hypothetical protein [Streptococcus suis]CYV07177.1 Uncharacterised protein [Streptococcus suis]HEM3580991.1 hypothetical protein [Streptococcus suis]
MIQKINILQVILIILILALLTFSGLRSEVSGLVLAAITFIYILSAVPLYYTRSKLVHILLSINALFLLCLCLSWGFLLPSYVSAGIVCLVGALQFFICFLLDKESASDLREELRCVQAFESKIDKNRSLSSLTKISYGLMLVSLLVQSFAPALFYLLVIKYLVDIWARMKLVKLFRGESLLTYLIRLIFLEQLVYIGLFCLLWTGSHMALYVGVLVFSNFLTPLLKQREYKLSRQIIAGKEQDSPDL